MCPEAHFGYSSPLGFGSFALGPKLATVVPLLKGRGAGLCRQRRRLAAGNPKPTPDDEGVSLMMKGFSVKICDAPPLQLAIQALGQWGGELGGVMTDKIRSYEN